MTEALPEPDGPPVRLQRIGAYAVVVVGGRVLLTQLSEDTPAPGAWTLPGGGIEHGEDPLDAVRREVFEETAHRLVDVELLDVGSEHFVGRAPGGRVEDFHSVQVIYRAGVAEVAEPRVLDVGGSTAQARWVPLAELAALDLSRKARRWVADVAPGLTPEA